MCCQAEEITLTIGQAFDLAYRRYHESTGQTVMNKQCMLLQKKVICRKCCMFSDTEEIELQVLCVL